MDENRLSKLKRSLDLFIRKAGKRRLIFDNFESRKEAKKFTKDMRNGITAQVEAIVTDKLLNDIIASIDKLSASQEKQVVSRLKESWKTFSQFVEEKNVFSFLIWSGEEGGKTASKLIGAKGVFSLKNGPIKDKLSRRSTFLIDSLDDSNLDSLKGVIIEGIEKDLSTIEMQKLISNRFEDEISKYRSEMITRTEFANAATLVSKESYKKNGVEKWEWVKAPGDEDICSENDGEVRKIGEDFPSGDERPPVHPNCTCDVIPVVPADFEAEGAWLGE